MGHQFEEAYEAELDATPEQVWEAIATGPGIDSWLMGRNEVEPGTGGVVRMVFAGHKPQYTVTGWEPPNCFTYRSDQLPDGRFIAYDYLIEGRGQGSAVLRLITSGFIPGDDWDDEYVAMTNGGSLFFHTLVEYLTYFAGRAATPVTLFGPQVDDWPQAMDALRAELELVGDAFTTGDRVRLKLDGKPAVDGFVYFVSPKTLGIRTGNALYGLSQGFHGPMVASLHIFADVDEQSTERTWQSWLARVFG